MPTIFIALQCCQCSTMQVKQKKKSSNKWSCVVCNQKQSVLKVFAQGFMAKDVRKFVQSFNTSRQFAEQQQQSVDHQTLDPPLEEIENQFQSNRINTRTDWSEFIDPENEDEVEIEKQDSGDVFEPLVVTELPKALFKKPKLRNHSPGLDAEKGEKLFSRVFAKRNAYKQISYLGLYFVDKEPSKYGGAMVNQTSKWGDCTTQANDILVDKEPMRCRPSTAIRASRTTDKGASKWNDYITEEDDLQRENWGGFADHADQLNSAAFETTLNDERVEEDIHPDFQ